MQVSGNFNLLFRGGLRKDWRDTYEAFQTEYNTFLRESTTDMPEQSAAIIAGMSRLVELGDGEPITYDQPNISPKVMGVDKEFGLGYALTKRTVEDDQYGKANSASKWLGHATAMTKEYRSAALLDDAFTGSTFLGIDSLSLCNTAHTLIGSAATVSNAVATPIGLSVTGVTSLIDLAQSLKDENNDPMVCKQDKFIVSNSAGDYHRAWQIFNTMKEPYTTENQDNAIRHRFPSVEIMMSHYKSTSTRSYWFNDSTLNDAHFVTRRAPEFEDDFDFNTSAALYKVTMRFLIWFVDWRGWFGANPT